MPSTLELGWSPLLLASNFPDFIPSASVMVTLLQSSQVKLEKDRDVGEEGSSL